MTGRRSGVLCRGSLLAAVLAGGLFGHCAHAQTRDLGGGFRDHGRFSAAMTSRGMVCTVDGEGNDVILVWLFDHRYAYALAVIESMTGDVELVPRPIAEDCPFASVLATNGRYYTHFGGHFMEFDPVKREFSFVQQTPSRAAMYMTEDDEGLIWAALYPGAEVVSFDPRTRALHDWGRVSEHPSAQYPRALATDDQGWVYVGIGLAVGQIFMLNPKTGGVTTVIPEEQRVGSGGVLLRRGTDGKVYGFAPVGANPTQWFRLYGGKAVKLDGDPHVEWKGIVAGSQKLRHCDLPNGEHVDELDLVSRRLVISDPQKGTSRTFGLDLGEGEGGAALGVATAPDGTIAGGTYIPLCFFNYNPRTDQWTRRESYGQWNAVTATAERFYAACYTEGVLLEWDPSREWVDTQPDNPSSNPRYLAQTRATPDVGRPYTIIAHPDGRHIIYGGTPDYGCTGGALVIYDTLDGTAQIIKHEDIVPWQTQASLTALADGRVVGGTAIRPGSGGTPKAQVAELYILDMQSRRVEWHAPLVADATQYTDLITGPDGKVFGIIDFCRLFVFDPTRREIVHMVDLEPEFGRTVYQQAPRNFVRTPDGRIFVLFRSGIAELDPSTYELTMLANAPCRLGNGGAYLDGRLYFAGEQNLLSWEVPAAR